MSAPGRLYDNPGRRTLRRLLAAALLLGIAARLVRYLLNFPLWGDEAFVAVEFLVRDFRGMLDPLTYGQMVPLGYLWAVLAVSRVAGLSEYALRFVAFAGGIAALLLFWRFAARHFGRRVTLLTVAFLAAAYYPIRHGAEVKPYSTDLLIAVGLLMAGWAVYARPQRPLRWIGLILLASAAVWCSYPSVFVSGAVGMLLTLGLWRGRRRTGRDEPAPPSGPATSSLRLSVSSSLPSVRWQHNRPLLFLAWAVFGLALCGSFIAMQQLYAAPQLSAAARTAEIGMWRKAFPPTDRLWLLPWWLFATHAGNMLAYPNGAPNGGSILTLALVISGCITLWRTRRRDLLLLLLGPLPLNLIAAALHKYPYGGTVRTSMFMAPAFCLLAGVGLFALIVRFLPRANYAAGESFRSGAAANWRAFLRRIGLRRTNMSGSMANEAATDGPAAGIGHAPLARDGLYISAGVLMAFAFGSIAGDLIQPYKKAANFRAREAIAWLAGESTAGDQWITFNSIEEGNPVGPYIAPWKGDGAQFIFYTMRDNPTARKILWAPPPAAVEPPPDTLWLLWYYGDNFQGAYSPEAFDAYLAALTARFGPPRRHEFNLQNRRGRIWQQIDVYEFPASRSAPESAMQP